MSSTTRCITTRGSGWSFGQVNSGEAFEPGRRRDLRRFLTLSIMSFAAFESSRRYLLTCNVPSGRTS